MTHVMQRSRKSFPNFSFGIAVYLLLSTVPQQIASLSSTTPSQSIDSKSNLLKTFRKDIASTELQRLVNAKVMNIARPVTIRAKRIQPGDVSRSNSLGQIKKTVHFQRHGQGYHNLLYNIWREQGLPMPDEWETIDGVPEQNPLVRSEIVDAPLTEKGRQKCVGWRDYAATIEPEIIIVSPMTRAIQTAQITFDKHWSDKGFSNPSSIPWVAHEDCREETGLFVCNKRRPLGELRKEFAHVDFSKILTEDDDMFIPETREPMQQQNDRIYSFLVDFIRTLPQQEIVVVGHSSWLFHMCNAVLDCDKSDVELLSWFATSEIRTLQLEYYSTVPE